MAEKEIRAAIIGGRGHNYLGHGLGKIEGVRLVALASDGLDDTVKRYGRNEYAKGAPYYEDYKKMLDEQKPDIVSVGAVHARAAAPILAALERGIHVLSDKPIADSEADVDRMAKILARNPSLHLMTEFDMRARPLCIAMRNAVRSGEIGDVVLVHGQKSYKFGESRPDFYKTREGYPGTIMFVSCHVIDLAYWVTGIRYTSAQGLEGNLSKKEYGQFEDHTAVMFRLANGGAAAFNSDFLRPATAPTHGDDRLRIAGSKGVIEMREEKCFLLTAQQPPQELSFAPVDHPVATEVINTLRGKGTGSFNSADSLYMARVLLKAREAADTGRTVTIA